MKNKIKIVFISSCSVNLKLNNYSSSKKQCEQYLIELKKNKKINLVILRLFNVYSSNTKTRGVIPDLYKKIKKYKRIKIDNYLNQRDFIHSEDVFNLIQKTLKNKSEGTFDVGSGKSISIINLAKKIKKILNKNIFIIKGIKKTKKNNFSRANILKTKKVFSWKNKIDLNEGLEKIA